MGGGSNDVIVSDRLASENFYNPGHKWPTKLPFPEQIKFCICLKKCGESRQRRHIPNVVAFISVLYAVDFKSWFCKIIAKLLQNYAIMGLRMKNIFC